MTTGAYDTIAKQMTQGQNVMTVISDPVPGLFVKIFAPFFARQVNSIVADLKDLIPACGNVQHSPRIVIGGHSAGGSAAFNAVLGNLFRGFEPAGFLGLDPYPWPGAFKTGIMQLPSMYWGFSETTCSVHVADAANAAYSRTNHDRRVLVQIQNPNSTMKHCSFTNTGCLFICGIDQNYKQQAIDIRADVGSTLPVFLQSVVTTSFKRSVFKALTLKVPAKVFFGDDIVP
jgi:hypothetical protein